MKLRVGTRGSPLALTQTRWVVQQLQNFHSQLSIEIIPIQSEGDQNTQSLQEIGGQGVFTAAVSQALIDQKVDIVVHSLKDLPTQTSSELTLGAIPPREDPRDLFIGQTSFKNLPASARVGTGSLRRRAQLVALRQDLEIFDLRGNIDTRIKKVSSGELEGIFLACAGVNRLQKDPSFQTLLKNLVQESFEFDLMTPAVGQGALGVECRIKDQESQSLLKSLDDPPTRQAVEIERELLRQLGGGCQIPFAAHVSEQTCYLVIADPETGQSYREMGSSDEALALMQNLLKKGKSVLARYLDSK